MGVEDTLGSFIFGSSEEYKEGNDDEDNNNNENNNNNNNDKETAATQQQQHGRTKNTTNNEEEDNNNNSINNRYSFNIFDGTNATGGFAEFIYEADSDDEMNDERETQQWKDIQDHI